MNSREATHYHTRTALWPCAHKNHRRTKISQNKITPRRTRPHKSASWSSTRCVIAFACRFIAYRKRITVMFQSYSSRAGLPGSLSLSALALMTCLPVHAQDATTVERVAHTKGSADQGVPNPFFSILPYDELSSEKRGLVIATREGIDRSVSYKVVPGFYTATIYNDANEAIATTKVIVQ